MYLLFRRQCISKTVSRPFLERSLFTLISKMHFYMNLSCYEAFTILKSELFRYLSIQVQTRLILVNLMNQEILQNQELLGSLIKATKKGEEACLILRRQRHKPNQENLLNPGNLASPGNLLNPASPGNPLNSENRANLGNLLNLRSPGNPGRPQNPGNLVGPGSQASPGNLASPENQLNLENP